MLERVAIIFALCCGIVAACSRTPPAPANFGMTPPPAWGPVLEDKMDDWSGDVASSPKAVCDQLVDQYKEWSKTTTIEEQATDHVVVRFDYADLVKGMARAAGTNPPPSSAKPLNRRMLIEVTPNGRDFAVRLRSFDIPG